MPDLIRHPGKPNPSGIGFRPLDRLMALSLSKGFRRNDRLLQVNHYFYAAGKTTPGMMLNNRKEGATHGYEVD
jgi:hypothetical protein